MWWYRLCRKELLQGVIAEERPTIQGEIVLIVIVGNVVVQVM
jgi:hypothetical protein